MLAPFLIQTRQDGRESCLEMSFSEVTIWLPPSARRNRCLCFLGTSAAPSLKVNILQGKIALFLLGTTVDLPLLPLWTSDTTQGCQSHQSCGFPPSCIMLIFTNKRQMLGYLTQEIESPYTSSIKKQVTSSKIGKELLRGKSAIFNLQLVFRPTGRKATSLWYTALAFHYGCFWNNALICWNVLQPLKSDRINWILHSSLPLTALSTNYR